MKGGFPIPELRVGLAPGSLSFLPFRNGDFFDMPDECSEFTNVVRAIIRVRVG